MIMKYQRGFSLIELLVVVAIIAILLSFLFPTFSSAKSQALATQDLSQLKQVVQSAILYATDDDDRAVPLLTSEQPQHFKTKANEYAWPILLWPYAKSADVFVSPVDSKLKPKVEEWRKLARKESSGGGCRPGIYASWGYNFVCFNRLKEGAEITEMDAINTKNLKGMRGISMSSIKAPSETILFANSYYKTEKVGYYQIVPPNFTNFWNNTSNKEFRKSEKCGFLRGWHGGGKICNAGFADGHVKGLHLSDFTANNGRIWKNDKQAF